MMAISGEAFLAAGRHVSDLLLRNLLNAFASTIWFTPMVVRLACLMLSLGWGLLSGGAFYAMHRSNGDVEATPGVNAVVLGSSVFVLTQFVLSFIGGILLSVLDAGGCRRHFGCAGGAAPDARPGLTASPPPPGVQSSSAGPSTATARRYRTRRCTPCCRLCPSRGPLWSSRTATCCTARGRRRLRGSLPRSLLRTSPPGWRTCEHRCRQRHLTSLPAFGRAPFLRWIGEGHASSP